MTRRPWPQSRAEAIRETQRALGSVAGVALYLRTADPSTGWAAWAFDTVHRLEALEAWLQAEERVDPEPAAKRTNETEDGGRNE
jgi:hypothetical protein